MATWLIVEKLVYMKLSPCYVRKHSFLKAILPQFYGLAPPIREPDLGG
jgi:hypothetical protein